jgi:hypothetical protein
LRFSILLKINIGLCLPQQPLIEYLSHGLCPQTALDSFPEISVVTELNKDGETPAFKVRLSGKAYNRKNMKPSKSPSKLPLVRGSMLTLLFTVQAGGKEGALSGFVQ